LLCGIATGQPESAESDVNRISPGREAPTKQQSKKRKSDRCSPFCS
jgi:hypothetical protein